MHRPSIKEQICQTYPHEKLKILWIWINADDKGRIA
jgi:hypothetical protein